MADRGVDLRDRAAAARRADAHRVVGVAGSDLVRGRVRSRVLMVAGLLVGVGRSRCPSHRRTARRSDRWCCGPRRRRADELFDLSQSVTSVPERSRCAPGHRRCLGSSCSTWPTMRRLVAGGRTARRPERQERHGRHTRHRRCSGTRSRSRPGALLHVLVRLVLVARRGFADESLTCVTEPLSPSLKMRTGMLTLLGWSCWRSRRSRPTACCRRPASRSGPRRRTDRPTG